MRGFLFIKRDRLVKWPTTLQLGLLILTFIIIIGLLAPVLAQFPYDEFHLANRLSPPTRQYWFGTDEFGRDVFSRVLFGVWSSLFMGVGATAVTTLIGVPLGLAAGYFSEAVDELIMRALDIIMSFPPIVLGLLMLAMTEPNLMKTAIAVGFVYVPTMARVTRSVTLSLVEEDFIEAAHASGASTTRVLFRELFPNAWPTITVEASIRVTFCILLGAALSFLGLGAQPPSSDWGLMISEARSYITKAPWIALSPGLAMCLTVIAFNFIGDGLRDLLDPRSTNVR